MWHYSAHISLHELKFFAKEFPWKVKMEVKLLYLCNFLSSFWARLKSSVIGICKDTLGKEIKGVGDHMRKPSQRRFRQDDLSNAQGKGTTVFTADAPCGNGSDSVGQFWNCLGAATSIKCRSWHVASSCKVCQHVCSKHVAIWPVLHFLRCLFTFTCLPALSLCCSKTQG